MPSDTSDIDMRPVLTGVVDFMSTLVPYQNLTLDDVPPALPPKRRDLLATNGTRNEGELDPERSTTQGDNHPPSAAQLEKKDPREEPTVWKCFLIKSPVD